MAERLTMTSDKGGLAFTFDLDITCRPSEMQKIVKLAEKLKHYEDLEEAGRLIELPCRIGDTVWDIKWWDDTTETRVIDGKTYFRRVTKHKVTKSKFSLFDHDNFGKTVFLTREEAERAIQEMEGKSGNETSM